MKINQMLSTINCNLNSNNPAYIIIHETDNTSKGAGAKRHCQAQANGNLGKASVHYYVDDTGVYQALEHKHSSWNCGDGNNKYGINNNNTISIEICVNPDSNYDVAVTNTVALVQYLNNGYYNNCKIVRHYDASRKHCPRRILDKGYWETFLNRVNGTNIDIPVTNPTPSKPNTNNESFSLGDLCTTDASGLNLRSIGSTSGRILATIKRGEIFTYNYVDEKYLGWYNVTFVGKNGFVSAEYVKKAKSNYNGQVVGVSSKLNVRSNPNGSIIGSLNPNEKVQVLEESNGWIKVKYDTSAGKLSKVGWVSAKYIKRI